MKMLSGKEFGKLLKTKDWHLVRIKGSHHVYMKLGHSLRIVVPVHSNKSLKIGLQKYLMKVAGIVESEL